MVESSWYEKTDEYSAKNSEYIFRAYIPYSKIVHSMLYKYAWHHNRPSYMNISLVL